MTTSNFEAVAADQLRAFIERIERLSDERDAIAGDIKEVFAEAKSFGFSVPVLRKIVAMRKKDASDRAEEETLLSLYARAIGLQMNFDLGGDE